MAINNISTALRNTVCDAYVDAIDAGSTDTGGDILIYTAGFGTLLAELEFSATAFGAASSGTATANAITSETNAPATGTAAVCRIRDQDNTTLFEGTVGTSGADINLSSASITAGDTVALTSFTFTVPAS